jgi:hypothetical protein
MPALEGGRYGKRENTRAGRDAGATENGFLFGFKNSYTDSWCPERSLGKVRLRRRNRASEVSWKSLDMVQQLQGLKPDWKSSDYAGTEVPAS